MPVHAGKAPSVSLIRETITTVGGSSEYRCRPNMNGSARAASLKDKENPSFGRSARVGTKRTTLPRASLEARARAGTAGCEHGLNRNLDLDVIVWLVYDRTDRSSCLPCILVLSALTLINLPFHVHIHIVVGFAQVEGSLS